MRHVNFQLSIHSHCLFVVKCNHVPNILRPFINSESFQTIWMKRCKLIGSFLKREAKLIMVMNHVIHDSWYSIYEVDFSISLFIRKKSSWRYLNLGFHESCQGSIFRYFYFEHQWEVPIQRDSGQNFFFRITKKIRCGTAGPTKRFPHLNNSATVGTILIKQSPFYWKNC